MDILMGLVLGTGEDIEQGKKDVKQRKKGQSVPLSRAGGGILCTVLMEQT